MSITSVHAHTCIRLFRKHLQLWTPAAQPM
jgi:hypothetical protein